MATRLPGRARIREAGGEREGAEGRRQQRAGKVVKHKPPIEQPE